MSLIKKNSNNYKRMAKNAGMLYFRMLFIIAITLYTSRIVLQTLGVEDFGVYSVVAGFVAMLGFLNNAMTASTQRFLSFELGKSENSNVQEIFSISMSIHVIIALFALILGETLGLWFIRTQLTIPIDRIFAAEWVFHLSIFAFMMTVVTVPYKALIISYERISVFAWISIFDVIFKLFAVFMLSVFGMDKLILYGLLNLIVVFIVFILYRIYCKTRLPESHYRFIWNQKLFKTMLSFTGWNLWSNLAYVMSGQGVNVLLNIFFGPTVNAARAIAMEVSIGLSSFVSSLQVAVNPQIVKSYAADDMDYMYKLVCYGAKYNFFLLFFVSMPVLINSDAVITLWLGLIPPYTSIFVKLIIINILIECMSGPLMTAANATGKIKLYQTIMGSLLLLNLPISYILLKLGYNPESVMYVGIFTAVLALSARLTLLRELILLPVFKFIKHVIGRSILIIITTSSAYYLLISYIFQTTSFWWQSTIMTMCVIITISVLGFDRIERDFILKNIIILASKFKR